MAGWARRLPAWIFYPLVLVVVGGGLGGVYLFTRASDARSEYRGPGACSVVSDDDVASLVGGGGGGASPPFPRRELALDVERVRTDYGRFGPTTDRDADVIGSSCRVGALAARNVEVVVLRRSQVGSAASVQSASLGTVLPADRTDRSDGSVLADELEGGACIASVAVPSASPDELVVHVRASTPAGCEPVVALASAVAGRVGDGG